MMTKLKYTGLAILFVGGIALAGSDGAYFPLINIVGFCLVVGFTLLVKFIKEK